MISRIKKSQNLKRQKLIYKKFILYPLSCYPAYPADPVIFLSLSEVFLCSVSSLMALCFYFDKR